uniref:Peptidase_S9 domain-containing protein n=1 Tax=Macrostomum lignano TaxID=282301 RepID=A0A1I8F792_9PLAT
TSSSSECVRNCSADPGPRECRYRIRLEWFMTMSKACFDCPPKPHRLLPASLHHRGRRGAGPAQRERASSAAPGFTSARRHRDSGGFAASRPPGRTTGTRTPVCSAARASSARWWSGRPRRPHAGLYDTDQPEHTLLLSDWFHELGATKFAAHHYSNGDNKPKGLIINGG